jgi:hypothetical protein
MVRPTVEGAAALYTAITAREMTPEELARGRCASRGARELAPWEARRRLAHKLRLMQRVRRRTSGVARTCYYASSNNRWR